MRGMFSVRNILPKPSQKNKPTSTSKPKTRKDKIPLALREQVWIHRMGRVFEGKCPVTWCKNTITVFDFESGHNIPESKGGATSLENLLPICSRCNKGMGNRHSIDEWCAKYHPEDNTSSTSISNTGKHNRISRFFSCFSV